jgi:dihydrodipicolinate synthase/N-acetylneuraminate lyase
MAYTTDSARFAKQVAAAKAVAGAQPVWAGIGAYQLSQPEIVANIRTARRLGVDGIILFSYDRLTGPQRGLEYLSAVAHAAFSE